MKLLNFFIFSAIAGICFFIFNNSFAVKDSSSQELSSLLVAENQISDFRLSKNQAPNSRAFKIKAFEAKLKEGQRNLNSSDEQYFTQKKPYKPKVEKEVLMTEFEKHLESFKKECDLFSENKKLERDAKMTQLINFLTKSLKDPYMDYETALLFADVLSIMEERNLKTSKSFNLSYRYLYNVPEEVKDVKNYEHEWAKIIYESIRCTEGTPI